MKILVPVKAGGRIFNVKVRVKGGNGSGIDLANVKMAMNPFSTRSPSRRRLRPKKEAGKATEVVLVSIGDRRKAAETIRTGLAMGRRSRQSWVKDRRPRRATRRGQGPEGPSSRASSPASSSSAKQAIERRFPTRDRSDGLAALPRLGPTGHLPPSKLVIDGRDRHRPPARSTAAHETPDPEAGRAVINHRTLRLNEAALRPSLPNIMKAKKKSRSRRRRRPISASMSRPRP